MFWKPRKSSLTIPAELHEKLVRTCEPVDGVDSEVVRVRSVRLSCPRHAKGKAGRKLMLAVGQ